MCDLYSLVKSQATIRDLFRVRYDRTGSLPLFPSIFPDQLAPIVRVGHDGERELVMARWGIPFAAPVRRIPITRFRYIKGPRLRTLIGLRWRCVVPATSFCEMGPHKTPKWFALRDDRPLFAFAGLWTPWRSAREGHCQVFGFLMTDANAVVAPIHPNAMPVILTTRGEVDQWLEADAPGALTLQRPLPDDALCIVASGDMEDRPSTAA
jgi:putative SOS response-associated peptidase YedK